MPIGPILRAMKHNRTRFALIILEIAITLAIVTNAVNMILVERAAMQQKSGFDDANLLFIRAQPFAPEFQEQTYVEQVVQSDLRALAGMPGVKAASATRILPWQGGGSSGTWKTEGYPEKFQAQIYGATRGIFDTLGVQIVAGRGFVETDTPADPNTTTTVTVISSGLAKKLWGDANPTPRAFGSTTASLGTSHTSSVRSPTSSGQRWGRLRPDRTRRSSCTASAGSTPAARTAAPSTPPPSPSSPDGSTSTTPGRPAPTPSGSRSIAARSCSTT